MNPPRLEACYFGQFGQPRWERMARVLASTAARHCPGWLVNVVPIGQEGGNQRIARKFRANTHKLDHWARVVTDSTDGDRLLLIDADTFITRSLDPVWDREFDVAYTTKRSEYPINGGVVFLRISSAVKAFVALWHDVNQRMMSDPGFHQPWKRRFAGVNQAALGYILTEARPALRFLELPCAEWNCEDANWWTFDPDVTRIVHVKAALQLACLETQPIPPELAQLAAMWRALDRAAAVPVAHTA